MKNSPSTFQKVWFAFAIIPFFIFLVIMLISMSLMFIVLPSWHREVFKDRIKVRLANGPLMKEFFTYHVMGDSTNGG